MMSWSRLLAWAAFGADGLINFTLSLWLLRVLYRYGARRELPWFFLYVVSEFISNVVNYGVWITNRGLYLPISWSLEILRVALVMAAVQESLLRIFRNLRVLLRWTAPIVIAVVALYSIWRTSHTPFPQDRVAAFVLAAEFSFPFGIAIVCTVMALLIWFVPESSASRAEAMIEGATIVSLAWVVWSISFSYFGPSVRPFAQYLPDLGYFVAARYWITAFARPVVKVGFNDIKITPEQAVAILRQDRRAIDEIDRSL
jgi:hypothetical protein